MREMWCCGNGGVLVWQEVDLGLAADVGTLQRLPRVVSSQSWVREVVYTARRVSAQEALKFGLVR